MSGALSMPEGQQRATAERQVMAMTTRQPVPDEKLSDPNEEVALLTQDEPVELSTQDELGTSGRPGQEGAGRRERDHKEDHEHAQHGTGDDGVQVPSASSGDEAGARRGVGCSRERQEEPEGSGRGTRPAQDAPDPHGWPRERPAGAIASPGLDLGAAPGGLTRGDAAFLAELWRSRPAHLAQRPGPAPAAKLEPFAEASPELPGSALELRMLDAIEAIAGRSSATSGPRTDPGRIPDLSLAALFKLKGAQGRVSQISRTRGSRRIRRAWSRSSSRPSGA